jgi:hypothetical protein
VTVALGLGRSSIVLANNVARLVGLPAAIAGVILVGGLVGLAMGFILGEILALLTAIILLNRATGKGLAHDLDRVAAFLLTSGAIVGWILTLARPSILGTAFVAALSALLVGWIARRESATLRDAAQLVGDFVRRARFPKRAPSSKTGNSE